MAGFDHGPAPTPKPEDDIGAERRARTGLALFAIYLLLYGGFMGLSTFFPQTMRSKPLAGITLAVTYGFGLILAAILLAFLYGWLCRATAAETRRDP
mgnify:CR=1 FL=1